MSELLSNYTGRWYVMNTKPKTTIPLTRNQGLFNPCTTLLSYILFMLHFPIRIMYKNPNTCKKKNRDFHFGSPSFWINSEINPHRIILVGSACHYLLVVKSLYSQWAMHVFIFSRSNLCKVRRQFIVQSLYIHVVSLQSMQSIARFRGAVVILKVNWQIL